MKVTNIHMPFNWEEIDIENDSVDVFVQTDDGFSYTLSFATTKHLQFLIEKEKMNYYGPGYPFIFVTKLTPEMIEQAVHDFAEESEGYWLKVYHFAGWRGAIDESIFDQLKAKRIKEREEANRFFKLQWIQETKRILNEPENQKDLFHLIEQYRSGNKHPGIGTKAILGSDVSELKVSSGARIYFREINDRIEVVGILYKDNLYSMIDTLITLYPKEN